MKHTLLISTIVLAAAVPGLASPFTLKLLPSGYSAKVVPGAGQFFSPAPVVVDIGWGRPVWYGGGLNFSTFPYAPNPLDPNFTLPLPVLTMPGFPGMTEKPQSGVVCDVDRDGDMDLVRINSWNEWDSRDTLQVFLNQGSGSFTTGYRLDTDIPIFPDSHARHYHIDCADFDGDGDPDMAILMAPDDVNRSTNPWRYEGTLTVRWNDGTGLFPTSTVLRGTGFNDTSAMVVADLDRDGDADILCDGQAIPVGGNAIDILSLRFTNSGTGTFTMTTHDELPARLADFNNDGWLDVAWRHYQELNDGTGFIDGIPSSSNFPGSGVKDHAYADADGDGLTDYIYNEGSNLVYRRGATGGSYFAAVPLLSLPSPAAAIGCGDSDHDGDTDFLLHLENGTFAFVENRSLHQEAWSTLKESVSVQGVTQLHAADFNRDGHEDLLAVAPSQKKLLVMFGEADGGPSGPVAFRSLASEPHSAAVADFDLDGRTDVAYTVPGTGEVRMARNNGNLLISWPDSAIATGLGGVSLLQAGGLGTPNGRTDLLTGNAITGQVRWLYQSGGTWNSQTPVSSFNPVPGAILAANASTRPGDEIFYLAADDSTIFLRGSQLNPTWVPLGTNLATPVSTAPLAEVLAWADVTGDNRCEVVFLKGDGALGYWNPLTAAGGTIGAAEGTIRAITPVDWDRDGRTDILCATSSGVSLFTWKGAWTHKKLPGSAACDSITTINLNGDAWMDAAVADSASGFVYFLTNTPRTLVAQHTSPPQVTLLNGQTATTASFNATSVGEPADSQAGSLADVNAVVSGVDVSFFRASANGSAWEKGTALTPGELSQAVSSIALVRSGTVIGSANSASLAGGRVSVNYVAGAGTLVPITPGSTQGLSIRLTVTASASQSAFSRFYMEFGSSVRGYPDDGLSLERAIPLAGVQPVLVSITPVLSPLQQWRQNNFGRWESSGPAANDADPDGDGVANLMEYLTSQNPNVVGGIGSSPVVGVSFDAGMGVMVADLRLLTAYDSRVKLTLQYTFNPAAGWSLLSTRTGTGAWTGITPYYTTVLGGGRTRFGFDGGFTPAIFRKVFFRLKAEELP